MINLQAEVREAHLCLKVYLCLFSCFIGNFVSHKCVARSVLLVICHVKKQNDRKERKHRLREKNSPQIAFDAKDRNSEQHKENPYTAGNQIQHKGQSGEAKAVEDTA